MGGGRVFEGTTRARFTSDNTGVVCFAAGTARTLRVSRQHAMLIGADHFARAVHLARRFQGIEVSRSAAPLACLRLMFEAHPAICAAGVPGDCLRPGPLALALARDAGGTGALGGTWGVGGGG